MSEPARTDFELVVVGASAGGMQALKILLGGLPADFALPLVIVQHLAASSDSGLATILDTYCAFTVKEADEKEQIRPGTAYIAPANYHLLVERDHTFTLTVDELVNYARPAIDVLFETAAAACAERLIGIVLTGANSDGAKGLRHIRDRGGLAIVQDPDTAELRSMPEAAIAAANPQHILPLAGIPVLLTGIDRKQRSLVSP